MCKFEVGFEDDKIIIIDTETGKILDMTDKYQVKQLVNILNDYHQIILDKWGLKK